MSRKHAALLALLVLILGLGSFTLPLASHTAPVAVARAQDSGVPIVVDDAHILDVARVEQAARKLQTLGVDVYVRTFPSFDARYGTLDAYVTDLVSRTPAWQGTNGQPKSNLLILAISLSERKTYIQYGSSWTPSIGANNRYLTIQTDYMNPRFRDGDYTGGFIAGLDQCYAVINNQLHPSATPAARPVDLSGLWTVLWFALLAGLAITLAAFAWKGAAILRRARAARQNALVAATQKQNQAATLVTTLQGETLQGLQLNLQALAERVPPDQLAELQAVYRTIEQAVTAAVMHYGSLAPFTPGDRQMSTTALQGVIQSYDQVIQELTAVQQSAANLDSQLVAILNAITHAGPAIDQAQTAIARAKEAVSTAAGQGFKTTEVAPAVATAEATASEARSVLAQRQYVQALKLATDASTTAQSAAQAAQELPQRKAQYAQQAAVLQARLDRLRQETLPPAQTTLTRVRSRYAPSAWQPIADACATAESALRDGAQALADGQAHASDERQEWTQALQCLDTAAHHLDTADQALATIPDLETRLATAEAQMPVKLEQASNQIAVAQRYLAEHADLNGVYQTRLQTAHAKLDEGGSVAQRQPTDVLAALALADAAYQEAALTLAAAQGEVAKREEERRRHDDWSGPRGPWPIFIGPLGHPDRHGSSPSLWGGSHGGGSTGWGGGGGGGGSTGWGGGGGGGGSTGW